MNKKVTALAVVAALGAAPAAFAEAVMYGKFHTSIDFIDPPQGGDARWEVNGRSSRLGVKGSEDLGDGLKAIYQLELGFNSDGGGSGQTGASSGLGGSSRNTFVGLAGGWGTFLIGRHDTPMKVAFYGSGNERLGDSAIDLNLSNSLTPSKSKKAPIGVFSEYRASDAIAYVSPNFSGFTVVGAIIPGEDSGLAPNDRDGIADHYSVGGIYKGGGLKASAGYTKYDGGTTDQKTFQIGGSFTFNNFSVGAQYEDTDNFKFTMNDYQAYAITGAAKFGNNALSLVWTDSEEDNVRDTTGWGVAAEHKFSKRTSVYAAYAQDDREPVGAPDEDYYEYSLGMIHNF